MSNEPLYEKELKAKLELEIPDGLHVITAGNNTMHTGKGGYINFTVALKVNMWAYMGIKLTPDKSLKEIEEEADKLQKP